MTPAPLPPLSLEEPAPRLGERLGRWAVVVALHGVAAYALLHYSNLPEILPLPPTLSVRLLPLQETKKPEPVPPPPPTPAVRKAAPQPLPVLAAKAPEAASHFAVAPQPPAPPAAPVVAAPPAPSAPASTPAVVAARFDADYLHNPKPVYPAFSRRNGEEGKVLLRVKVSADGTALELDIKQSSGFPRLDNAAREAVAKWRFVPARRGEDAIESWVTVPLTFALE